MIIAGIETSTETLSLALGLGPDQIIQKTHNERFAHSKQLAPMLEELLQEQNLSFKDIHLWTVNKGPGSFTGVRIGLSFVQGLCHGLGSECLALSSLEALSEQAPQGLEDPLLVSLDARQDHLYCAWFQWDKTQNLYTLTSPIERKNTEQLVQSIDKDFAMIGPRQLESAKLKQFEQAQGLAAEQLVKYAYKLQNTRSQIADLRAIYLSSPVH